jgi:signal transduction histidine kinase
MKADRNFLSGQFSGLSTKLIATLIAAILLVEIVIYLPSVANYRASWLQDRLRMGIVAARVIEAVPDATNMPRMLKDRLLNSAGADSIVYRTSNSSQLIEPAEPALPKIITTADMRRVNFGDLASGALGTLLTQSDRTLRIVGHGDVPGSTVELMMPERPLRRDMFEYAHMFALTSLIIAVIAASVVYVFASFFFIRPTRKLAVDMLAFREAPEDATRILVPSNRQDEIGILQQELAAMERALFSMLRQRRHLADLGLAVAKINHDLRNTLASAQLLSDQVATLDDPNVQRLAPRLVTTLDRAIGFTQSVLDYGRESAAPPNMTAFGLQRLIDDAAFDARVIGHPTIQYVNEVPSDLSMLVDTHQMSRVFLNILKNAREALEIETGTDKKHQIYISCRERHDSVVISIQDNGPGLAPKARENLFVAFEGSARAGGVGLGLAIAREITEAHGGRLVLGKSAFGTRFDISLPISLRVHS